MHQTADTSFLARRGLGGEAIAFPFGTAGALDGAIRLVRLGFVATALMDLVVGFVAVLGGTDD